jgi:hypothetical protein
MCKQTGSRYSFTAVLAHWEKLLAGAEANRDDLPALEQYRAQLEAALEDTGEIRARRQAHRSAAQRATDELYALARLGRELAAQLESGVRLLYGRRSPKLAEFGMKALLPRRKPKASPRCSVKGCPLEATATVK